MCRIYCGLIVGYTAQRAGYAKWNSLQKIPCEEWRVVRTVFSSETNTESDIPPDI
jgi:hypothetical protein